MNSGLDDLDFLHERNTIPEESAAHINPSRCLKVTFISKRGSIWAKVQTHKEQLDMADIFQEGISGCSGIQVSLDLKGSTSYMGASNQTKPPARCTSPPKYHITVQCMNPFS